MKVIEEDGIKAYLEGLSDDLEQLDDEVATVTYWQLHDFGFECVVVLDGDVTLKKERAFFR